MIAPPTDPDDALPRPREEALVHDLPSFHWDSREAVRYEVAIEAINRAIGAYTARPDTVLLARLRAEMIVCGQSAVASIRSTRPRWRVSSDYLALAEELRPTR